MILGRNLCQLSFNTSGLPFLNYVNTLPYETQRRKLMSEPAPYNPFGLNTAAVKQSYILLIKINVHILARSYLLC